MHFLCNLVIAKTGGDWGYTPTVQSRNLKGRLLISKSKAKAW